MIVSDLKPILRHQTAGFTCDSAELRAAGRCLLNGKEFEFQDIRVYLKETNQ